MRGSRGLPEPLFSVREQLIEDAVHLTLPNQPCITLSRTAVHNFLEHELQTPILDELFPNLWLVATQSSTHVDPLHRQKIKGRHVVITEDPKLHLVWHSDVIYIKPITECLLNYEFWKTYLCVSSDCDADEASRHTDSALGFLHTYSLLIRHPSDLRLATESHLVPEHIEWNRFAQFIEPFRHLGNDRVSPRYHYGQLRLTRLNWAVRVFRPKSCPDWWYYHETYWNTSSYIQRFFGPLLFIFGSLAIILTAMQVIVTVPQGSFLAASQWMVVEKACWGFSIAMILAILILWFSMVGGLVVFLIAQLVFSAKTRISRGRIGGRYNRSNFCEEVAERRVGKGTEAGGRHHEY